MPIFIAVIELLGAWILKFFGISLPILQVAGGVTLAAIGWRMLNAPDAATPAAAAIQSDSHAAVEKVFYPLTFPLTVGPGTIVVVLTLSANASGHRWTDILLAHVSIFVASALLALVVFLSYGYPPCWRAKFPSMRSTAYSG